MDRITNYKIIQSKLKTIFSELVQSEAEAA